MIIDSIREYFLDCPILDEYARLNVDFLGVEPTQYTIEGQPVNSVIERYVDGGALKQFVFVFGSREYYGPDVLQNVENSGFYERFADWLDEQTKAGDLPRLSGGRSSQGIEALTTGYLFDSSEDNARYQIQCRLIYYED